MNQVMHSESTTGNFLHGNRVEYDGSTSVRPNDIPEVPEEFIGSHSLKVNKLKFNGAIFTKGLC